MNAKQGPELPPSFVGIIFCLAGLAIMALAINSDSRSLPVGRVPCIMGGAVFFLMGLRGSWQTIPPGPMRVLGGAVISTLLYGAFSFVAFVGTFQSNWVAKGIQAGDSDQPVSSMVQIIARLICGLTGTLLGLGCLRYGRESIRCLKKQQ